MNIEKLKVIGVNDVDCTNHGQHPQLLQCYRSADTHFSDGSSKSKNYRLLVIRSEPFFGHVSANAVYRNKKQIQFWTCLSFRLSQLVHVFPSLCLIFNRFIEFQPACCGRHWFPGWLERMASPAWPSNESEILESLSSGEVGEANGHSPPNRRVGSSPHCHGLQNATAGLLAFLFHTWSYSQIRV